MLALARRGHLSHFDLAEERLDDCVDFVIETAEINYPRGDIPFHARWRHFTAGGRDLWKELDPRKRWPNPDAWLRSAWDLAIVSVLLDAGAGPDWSFREPLTGVRVGRSEGLGLASLDMFRQGFFSAVPDEPLRVDGQALASVTGRLLAAGFQVSDDNPLVGLDGRAELLRRLGESMARTRSGGLPAVDDAHRPSRLLDLTVQRIRNGDAVTAPAILQDVLAGLGPIWPERADAVPGAGDTWRYTGLDGTTALVPFHKLSQWLTYSLIEPLQAVGVDVREVNGLTGLPEYRNGGLFIDTGVLNLKDQAMAAVAHPVGSDLVVEWRALTVALLDLVAERMRAKLKLEVDELPLAKVLEGGTWSAGRRIAREKRAGGGPPLGIISDGTVF